MGRSARGWNGPRGELDDWLLWSSGVGSQSKEGRKKKELRGKTSHVNSCGNQSANLEHQTPFLDFAGFAGASV